jgi:polyhydroxybutyrate depolymerase
VSTKLWAVPSAVNGNWDLPKLAGRTTSDTRFIADMIGQVENSLCVDSTRRYAAGMSLGSAMTLALACAPNPSFAAFGGVGASFYRPQCADSPPAPLIHFHGTDDKIVPYQGGSVAGSPRGSITRRVAPVEQSMAEWAGHNGCSPIPTTTEIGDTTNIVWGNCQANATVNFYRVIGGGHTWPGTGDLIAAFTERSLGRTTQAVKATDVMWEFFKQYQLTPVG